MGIVNRSMDASEQRVDFTIPLLNVTGNSLAVMDAGATALVWMAPYPCVIEAARCQAAGISTGAVLGLWKWSHNTKAHTGISMTVYAIGTSNAPAAAGFTTGAGATCQQFSTGDMLSAENLIANSAIKNGVLAITVKKLQDIATHLGV